MSEEQNPQSQEVQTYEPPEEFVKQANVTDPSVYEKAEEDFEEFWASWARELHWFKDWDQTLKWEPPFAEWFVGGKINAAYNCLDYQIEQGRGDKNALIWIGDEPGTRKDYTYNELLAEVSKFANVLERPWDTEGRRGGDLPLDGPGTPDSDAGLRPHRGAALGGL